MVKNQPNTNGRANRIYMIAYAYGVKDGKSYIASEMLSI